MADRQRAYSVQKSFSPSVNSNPNPDADTAETDSTDAAQFSLPVDSEHKARKFRVWSVAQPHMRAFHLSWFSFFVCFTSTFAAAPLIPVIRDDLDLRRQDVANSNIASVSGSVFSRLAVGVLCDLVGPRYACAFLIMLTAPAVFSMAAVSSVAGYVLVRFFISWSLATFVSCQFWMTSMFNSKLVGLANGVAAGWGNVGGGATQLIMPLVFHAIQRCLGHDAFQAWRVAFFVPGILQMGTGLAVLLLGQDLPDGNYAALSDAGQRKDDSLKRVAVVGFSNYRAWLLALTYGYCFGVELTVDNIVAEYFFDKFGLNLNTAGTIAASFGLANIFSRPGGGILSDFVARRLGMRGRIWALWLIQTLGGLACVALGMSGKLGQAVATMLVFSVLVQAACGLTYGIVPFVSIRALGLVSGITASGGNIGAVVTQALFFSRPDESYDRGITLMGFMIVAVSLALAGLYFPQWGGMLFPASDKESHTEENYYASEWTEEEKLEGNHANCLKFARNTRSERGRQKPMIYADTPLQGNCPVPA